MAQTDPYLSQDQLPSSEKWLIPILYFIHQRAYVFDKLKVGCFVRLPNTDLKGSGQGDQEIQLFLQKENRPFLYLGQTNTLATFVVRNQQYGPGFRSRVLSHYSDQHFAYIADTLNRLIEHYQLHQQDYHFASDAAYHNLTQDSRYFFLLTPK